MIEPSLTVGLVRRIASDFVAITIAQLLISCLRTQRCVRSADRDVGAH